jgi:predicted DsbA family dithiol-disulfide isomerase
LIDVISDVICPWCYIGKRQMDTARDTLATQGLRFDVRWHPFQLNPDMPEAGMDRQTYRRMKFGDGARSTDMDTRLTEAGAAVGIDFRFDRIRRTPNTLAAHRTLRLAGLHGSQHALAEVLFHAYFTEGQDIGDPAVLAACAAQVGLDADGVATMLAGDEGREAIEASAAAAREAGISGVPSFVMQGHVLFSGAVPADTMVEAFGRAWRILSANAA